MTILVTGCNGQLGCELKDLASKESNLNFLFTDYEELDISNELMIDNYFRANNIDFIINCAAYTAVDDAEENEEQSNLINNIALKYLVKYCKKYDVKLIHISTDYVFDGSKTKPYFEYDITNPKSVYGLTKLNGEMQVMNSNLQCVIIRTSWLYSSYGSNFVKTMIRLSKEKNKINVISDQFGTPTYAYNLAELCLKIINDDNWPNKPELYHYSDDGECTWFDFAKEIFHQCSIKTSLIPIDSYKYKTKAYRPRYSVLSKDKLIYRYGIDVPNWKRSLRICLNKLNYTNKNVK